MTELATHFVRLLGQTTVALAVAVIAVSLILRGLRVTSPTAHRAGWTLALLVGWWFVRLSAQVPWYEPTAELVPTVVADETFTLGPSQYTGIWTELPTAQIAADTPHVAQAPPEQENGLIEIGPGGDAATNLEPATDPAPLGDLAVDVTLPTVEPEMPIIVAGGKLRDRETPAEAPTEASAASTADAATTAFHVWPIIALVIWACGVCAAVVLWAVGYARFVRRLPPARPAPESWADQWRALQIAHKIRRQIPLRVTEQLGPMLCRLPRGYALLVPETLWRDLDSSQRAAVLRHELAHFQRSDVWKSLAVRVLALPHWFNPLAWLAVRRFDDAAEWACDHTAAANEPATKYARTLVRLGESAARHAAYSPAARGASLRGRVRRLLNAASDRDSLVKKLLLSAMALVAVIGLAVRVELVAKERVEAPISESTDQPTADAAKAEDGAATLPPVVYGTVEVEPLSEADAELVEAAERGFNAAAAAYANDTITLDIVCGWSLRWLSAIEVTAKSPPDRVAAARANLERFQALRLQIKALFDVGARGGEAEKLAMTDYYVADAKRRLAIAQRDADSAKQRLQKARTKVVDQENLLQESKTRVNEIRQAEARVEAAGKKLGELSKAHFAANIVNNPALYEATRLQAVEAEHELDAAIRDAIAARRAFAGGTRNSTKPVYSADAQAKIHESQERLKEANGRRVDAQQKITSLRDEFKKAEDELATAKTNASKALSDLERSDSKARAIHDEITAHDQTSSELQKKSVDGESDESTKQRTQEREHLQKQLDVRSKELQIENRQLEEFQSLRAAEAKLALLKQQYEQLWAEENAYYHQMQEVRIHLYELGVELAESRDAAAEKPQPTSPKPTPDDSKKVAASPAPTAVEDRLAKLVGFEEDLRKAKARHREAQRAQTAADRTGDDEKIAAAERDLNEAKQQLDVAETVVSAARGIVPKPALAQEYTARIRLDQADFQLELAQRARTAAASKEQNPEGMTGLADANQALAVAKRESREAFDALQAHLRGRIQQQSKDTSVQPVAVAGGARRVFATNRLTNAPAQAEQVRQELMAAESQLIHLDQVRETTLAELQTAHDAIKAIDEQGTTPSAETREKIQKDHKVRKLEEDIAEYDAAITKYETQTKPAPGKVKHTLEILKKERAGLQGKLAERTKELEEKLVGPEREHRLQEAKHIFLNVNAELKRLDAQILESRKQIQAIKALVNPGAANPAASQSEDRKQNLRYNGRSFQQWRDELETELSPDRLTEACEAFAAFARSGYGAEAAGPIVDAVGDRMTASLDLKTPEGRLVDEAAHILASLPIEDILPSLTQSLASSQLGRRMFVIYVLFEHKGATAASLPLVLRASQDADSMIATSARQLLDKVDFENDSTATALPELPSILPWLKEQGTPQQAAVFRLINSMRGAAEPAVSMLIEVADGGSPGDQEAIRCLGSIGPKAAAAVPKLMAIANSRSETGAAAVRALGRMGPAAKEAIPLLEKFVTRDDWPHLREDAKVALPFIRGERPLSELKPDDDGNRRPKSAEAAPAKTDATGASPTIAK